MDSPPSSTVDLPSSAGTPFPPPSDSDTESLGSPVFSNRRSSMNSSNSGLPQSYYNKYYTTKRFDLAERQRTVKGLDEEKKREEDERRRREEEKRRRKEEDGDTVLTDHLEAAVDNLFKLVERKVIHETPHLLPSRGRSSSWSSSAIRSEVSKLYHTALQPSSSPTPSPTPSYLRMRNPSFDAGAPHTPRPLHPTPSSSSHSTNSNHSHYAFPHLPPITEHHSTKNIRYLDPRNGNLHESVTTDKSPKGFLKVMKRSSSLPIASGVYKDNKVRDASSYTVGGRGEKKDGGMEFGEVVWERGTEDRVGKWLFAFGGCCGEEEKRKT
ncbi:hypothetical protein HK097_002442 [Rhizophlyctis rosea]|uniref:Uncharacterized protein n=1 Tax=Rhizophlyctis rosea TaxID=64517 RepID=A0AAD5S5D9_9FUNG|nr:hypothetical protein HK097_002442 [Rhizophlyctis rosea]